MRMAAKVDNNHVEIVTYARSLGYECKSTAAMSKGFPDCILSSRDEMWLMEIKDGETAELTADQKDFIHAWTGKPILIIRDKQEFWKFHEKVIADKLRREHEQNNSF